MRVREILLAIPVVVIGSAASALCPAPPVSDPASTVLKMKAVSGNPGIGSVAALGNDARRAGSLVYDDTNKVLSICDGSQWNALSVGGSKDPLDECKTAPVNGICSDGSVYIGSPFGRRLYVARADEGVMKWQSSRNNDGDFSSTKNGHRNTRDAGVKHEATNACRKKNHGWYLPAVEELEWMLRNRSSFPAASVSGTEKYWSSTIVSTNSAYMVSAATQWGRSPYTHISVTQDTGGGVRCVRIDREDVPSY